MRDLFQLLETVAATSSTVLITGETGTGKELAARAIHHNSAAARQPVRRAELQRDPGDAARSGALRPRAGRLHRRRRHPAGPVEQAHKGTLFLDEVGTMSPALQAKLLRVLQEREFERVGDSHTIKIDVRVIAATHSDLAKMVADGTFREDLFYRLNVLPVQLPPLRERREDIPLLVQHFLQRLAPDSGRRRMTVSQEAMRRLMAYRWPGNVRQLENAVERALAFTQGRSQIDVHGPAAGSPESRRRRSKDRSPGCRKTASTSSATSKASSSR